MTPAEPNNPDFCGYSFLFPVRSSYLICKSKRITGMDGCIAYLSLKFASFVPRREERPKRRPSFCLLTSPSPIHTWGRGGFSYPRVSHTCCTGGAGSSRHGRLSAFGAFVPQKFASNNMHVCFPFFPCYRTRAERVRKWDEFDLSMDVAMNKIM